MKHAILLALLPLTALAQFTFGPLRLDGGVGESFEYPSVEVIHAESLLCTWGEQRGAASFSAQGQMLAPDGTPLGGRIVFRDQIQQATCAPKMDILPLTGGGEARLFFQS